MTSRAMPISTSGKAAGAAYNSLSADQQAQGAAAKAVRLANTGVLFDDTETEPYKGTLPAFVISPSYKMGQNLAGRAARARGEPGPRSRSRDRSGSGIGKMGAAGQGLPAR